MPLAFENDSSITPGQETPVYILGITLKNDLRPRYQPFMDELIIEKRATGAPINWTNIVVRTPEDSQVEAGRPSGGFSHLIVIEPTQSNQKFILREITGHNEQPSFYYGYFLLPLDARIGADTNGIFYLGHISGVIRARQPNELRAGHLILFANQIQTGFFNGSFTITIDDRFEQDISELITHIPQFKDKSISKKILPPHDYKRARQHRSKTTLTYEPN